MSDEKKRTGTVEVALHVKQEDMSNLGEKFFEAIAGKPEDCGRFFLGY